MVKKTLLSLAIAATAAGLAGCNISSVEKYNDNVDSTPVTAGDGAQPAVVSAIFNPARSALPLATDFLFSDSEDGTLVYAQGEVDIFLADGSRNPDYNPVYDAMSDLDGFSTVGQLNIPFSGSLTEGELATGAVYLVPLNYEGGPKTGELVTAAPFGASPAIKAEVISYADGNLNNSVVRLSPTEPLQNDTRYLVILTDKIKDIDGDATVMPSQYEYLIGDDDLLTAALAPARTVMKGWYQLAQGYMAALSQDPADITVAYTFTTGGTTEVLNVMAAPGNADAALSNASIPTNIQYLVNASASDADAVATLMGAPYSMTEADATAIVGLGTLPSPSPRVTDFSASISTSMATILDGASSTFRTGSIELPYYSQAPLGAYSDDDIALDPAANDNYVCADTSDSACLMAKSSAANVVVGQWASDENVIYNLTADATKVAPSENVTNLFPFAKENGSVSVPVLVVEPDTGDCAKPGAGWPVVIFEHGIRGNRMQGIALAEQFAGACYATIAIDLPMHGLMPTDVVSSGVYGASGTLPMMAAVAESAGVYPVSTFAGLDADTQELIISGETLKQRHFALTAAADGATPQAVEGTSADQSGSLYIDFLHFQTTRDNNRQAVMDLLNLDASIPFMDIDNDSAADFDADNIYFASISLGSIVGAQFVAVNNVNGIDVNPAGNSALNRIQAAVFAVPGGGLPKMLEGSNAFGPSIVGALTNPDSFNLTQGGDSYESLMYVYQATVDSADPINFATQLAASQTPYTVIESVGDNVIPNSVEGAPLAGTEPLLATLGATQVDTSSTLSAAGQVYVKLADETSNHASFILPDTDDATAETTATFGILAAHAISLFSGSPILNDGGAGIVEAIPTE